VAADAADLGASDLVKRAVMGITASDGRDSTAKDASLRLAKAGDRVGPEVATVIVFTGTRDETLKRLAQGGE
jgi:hypothetical protein